jgi:hypothetical protein
MVTLQMVGEITNKIAPILPSRLARKICLSTLQENLDKDIHACRTILHMCQNLKTTEETQIPGRWQIDPRQGRAIALKVSTSAGSMFTMAGCTDAKRERPST